MAGDLVIGTGYPVLGILHSTYLRFYILFQSYQVKGEFMFSGEELLFQSYHVKGEFMFSGEELLFQSYHVKGEFMFSGREDLLVSILLRDECSGSFSVKSFNVTSYIYPNATIYS